MRRRTRRPRVEPIPGSDLAAHHAHRRCGRTARDRDHPGHGGPGHPLRGPPLRRPGRGMGLHESRAPRLRASVDRGRTHRWRPGTGLRRAAAGNGRGQRGSCGAVRGRVGSAAATRTRDEMDEMRGSNDDARNHRHRASGSASSWSRWRAAMMIFGSGRSRTCRSTSSPSSRPPRVEIQTICPRPRRRRGRGARHRAARAGAGGRCRPRCHALEVGAATCRSIVLIFEPGTDCSLARQHVQERIGQVDTDAADLGQPAGHDAAALGDQPRDEDRSVARTSMSLIDMSMIAYWTIRPRLLACPGVANVAIWGERLQMSRCRSTPS